MTDLSIQTVENERGKICGNLLRSLPEWFGIESAIQQYIADADSMLMFAAFKDEQVVGFVSLKVHNSHSAEIHVMAVHPEYHRQGIGKKMLQTVESELSAKNFAFLSVKTLSPARESVEYQQTRLFYEAMSFLPFEEFKNLWGEDNPCLVMVKSLKS